MDQMKQWKSGGLSGKGKLTYGSEKGMTFLKWEGKGMSTVNISLRGPCTPPDLPFVPTSLFLLKAWSLTVGQIG